MARSGGPENIVEALLRILRRAPGGLSIQDLREHLGPGVDQAVQDTLRQGKIVKWGARNQETYSLPLPPAEPPPRSPPPRRTLDALRSWPFTHLEIHDPELHRSLEFELARLSSGQAGEAPPFVLAHVLYLVATKRPGRARVLLAKFPGDKRSLASYLHFALDEDNDPPSGTIYYSTLAPEDFFLGACYCSDDVGLAAILRALGAWDPASVRAALSSGGETRPWNTFKSLGLQPRIAEKAFREVFGLLHGSARQGFLRDLNAEHVRVLPLPWIPHTNLPPADWSDGQRTYDVKCNILFPSKSQSIGLRGFLIRDVRQGGSFPGFMFTAADSERCTWVYVGEYEGSQQQDREDRILPFLFRLPSRYRFEPQSMLTTEEAHFLQKSLPLGAELGLIVDDPNPETGSHPADLVGRLIARLREKRSDAPLEYLLWHEVTLLTFDALNTHRAQRVAEFLRDLERLVDSPFLPVRLPRVYRQTLQAMWIDQVLQPIVLHWPEYRCEKCHARTGERGGVEVKILRVDAGGSVLGRITCRACGHSRDPATLVTHCYRCNQYPLVIAKNPTCRTCGGLVCHGSVHLGEPCGACKKGCVGA